MFIATSLVQLNFDEVVFGCFHGNQNNSSQWENKVIVDNKKKTSDIDAFGINSWHLILNIDILELGCSFAE